MNWFVRLADQGRLVLVRVRRHVRLLPLVIGLLSSIPVQGLLRKVVIWGLDKQYGDAVYKWLIGKLSWVPGMIPSLQILYLYWYEISQVVFLGSVCWLLIDAHWRVRRERTRRIIAETLVIPRQKRGLCDFGAGVEEALDQVKRGSKQIAAHIRSFGRTAERHAEKFRRKNENFVKKRTRAEQAADAFDRISSSLTPIVVDFEQANLLLQANWVELLKRLNSAQADAAHAAGARELSAALIFSIQSTGLFRTSVEGLYEQHMSQRLDGSMIRLLLIIDRIRNSAQIAAEAAAEGISRHDARSASHI